VKVSSYFNRYLRAIQPSRSSRERAIQLHTTLVRRLHGHTEFDKVFDSSFLYGSYRRNTALNPIKDVDACIIMNIDYQKYTPKRIVNYLRDTLEGMEYKDKTAHQQRSIRIDMSGTTLDVIPVVIEDDIDKPLRIPDQKLGKWIFTHPKGHMAEATRLNALSGDRFIPLVKIVKNWYRYQCRDEKRPKPKGFTLEALVAQYQDAAAPSYAEAFVDFLSNYWNAAKKDLQKGVFPAVNDPGRPGEILTVTFSTEEAKAFGVIVESSLNAAKTALALDGDIRDSAVAWREILGPKFPTGPARIVKSIAESTFSEIDDEPMENVMEIDLPQATGLAPLTLRIEVAESRDGRVIHGYESDGNPLQKGRWLLFTVVNAPVAQPFEVSWTVTNHGTEAILAKNLTHTSSGSSTTHWESTLYRGSHWMTCEIKKSGIVVARERVFINIS